jgi:hypothetical protein
MSRQPPHGTTVRDALPQLEPLLQLLGLEKDQADRQEGTAIARFWQLPLFSAHNVSITHGERRLPKPVSGALIRQIPPREVKAVPFLVLELRPRGERMTLYASGALEAESIKLAREELRVLELPLDARVLQLGIPFHPGLSNAVMPPAVGLELYTAMFESHMTDDMTEPGRAGARRRLQVFNQLDLCSLRRYQELRQSRDEIGQDADVPQSL